MSLSLEHSPARSRTSPAKRAAFTIDEFCSAHRISRGMLYKLWSQDLGPRFINIGKKKIISDEAAADWRAEGERRATGEAA
jgi:hypothetical protein